MLFQLNTTVPDEGDSGNEPDDLGLDPAPRQLALDKAPNEPRQQPDDEDSDQRRRDIQKDAGPAADPEHQPD